MNYRSIKGIFYFEFVNSAKFPILEIFFINSLFLLSISFYFDYLGTYIEGIQNTSLLTILVNHIGSSTRLFLLINSILMSFLIINSFWGEDNVYLIKTFLSFPISRELLFVSKSLFYLLFSLIVSFFTTFLVFILYPVKLDLFFYFFTLYIVILNQLLTIILCLILVVKVHNFSINMLLMIFLWVFLFFMGGSLLSGFDIEFLKIIIQPQIVYDYYFNNELLNFLIQNIFIIILFILIYGFSLHIFRNIEIS
jgi:hypothetical protein